MAIADRHPGHIHLLITDMILPRLSGRELAARLGIHRPAIKVLYVSGTSDEAIARHRLLAPGTEFLEKPFSIDGLLRKVRQVLGDPAGREQGRWPERIDHAWTTFFRVCQPSAVSSPVSRSLPPFFLSRWSSRCGGRGGRRETRPRRVGSSPPSPPRMREGVIAYDMHRRLIRINPAFERLTGYGEDEVRDQEFLQYIHPDDRRGLLAEWDRLEQGGMLRDQEYRVVTRAGQVRWCASTWETLRDKIGRRIGFLGTEFDITDRKVAEEDMRLDTDLFQAVVEIQQAVAGAGLDSATVMHVIAERSKGLTRASGAVIESLQEDELVPQVSVGTEALRLKMATSLSGLAIRTGELQRSDDVSSDTRISHSGYQAVGIRSLLVVPLRDNERTLGTLKVVSPEANAFSDRDAKALRLLGGFAGAALGHAAAYEGRQARLEDRTRALQDSEQRFKQLVDVAQEGSGSPTIAG